MAREEHLLLNSIGRATSEYECNSSENIWLARFLSRFQDTVWGVNGRKRRGGGV